LLLELLIHALLSGKPFWHAQVRVWADAVVDVMPPPLRVSRLALAGALPLTISMTEEQNVHDFFELLDVHEDERQQLLAWTLAQLQAGPPVRCPLPA
jgi:hypothetical protein